MDSSVSSKLNELKTQREELRSRFWRSNVRLVSCLMACWAFLSLGCGVLFSGFLDRWTLPGTSMPLGFFMAQQGAIYGFLLLIVIYIWRMGSLEKQFKSQLAALESSTEPATAGQEAKPEAEHQA